MARKRIVQDPNAERPDLDAHDGCSAKPEIKNGGPDKVIIYLAIEVAREDLEDAWQCALDGAVGYGSVIGAEIWLGNGD